MCNNLDASSYTQDTLLDSRLDSGNAKFLSHLKTIIQIQDQSNLY